MSQCISRSSVVDILALYYLNVIKHFKCHFVLYSWKREKICKLPIHRICKLAPCNVVKPNFMYINILYTDISLLCNTLVFLLVSIHELRRIWKYFNSSFELLYLVRRNLTSEDLKYKVCLQNTNMWHLQQ